MEMVGISQQQIQAVTIQLMCIIYEVGAMITLFELFIDTTAYFHSASFHLTVVETVQMLCVQ